MNNTWLYALSRDKDFFPTNRDSRYIILYGIGAVCMLMGWMGRGAVSVGKHK